MAYDSAADAASGNVGLETGSGADHGSAGHHGFVAHQDSQADGAHAGGPSVHLDAAGADVVQVPDAELLFTGHYRHAGPDLVIAGDHGHQILITDYFTGAHSPALMAPNGAALSGELVAMMAGSATPDHYAQTTAPAPADAIGKVEKITGTVTVVRNGVSVALNSGDQVFKSDVIQTGPNSSAGIDFPDGTALNLVANTRMAMSDYSFDPNGHANVAVFSLVEGTFAFVAGKVAHSGDMKVETPVATMGIRGTTGYVQEQVATITANLGGVTYSFAVTEDYGTGRVGQYELIDQNGNVIATVSQNGYITYVTPQGPNLPPLVSTQPMNNSQVTFEQDIIQQVFQTLLQGNPGLDQNPNANPQSNPSAPGSSTPPDQLKGLPQLLQNGTQQQINIAVTGPNGTTVNGTATVTPTSNSPTQTASSTTTSSNDLTVSTGTTTISSNETVDNLTVAANAILEIVSPGSLTVTGSIDDYGTIKVTTTVGDPLLQTPAPVTIESTGKLEATGVDSSQTFLDNVFTNAGTVIATNNGGTIGFQHEQVTNTNLIEATAGGVIEIENSTVTNSGGTVEATGAGSEVTLAGANITGGILETGNSGVIETTSGTSTVTGVTIADGTVLETADGTALHLSGTTTLDGTVTLESIGSGDFTLVAGDQIVSGVSSATLDNTGTIKGAGEIGGALTLSNSGTVDADISGGTLTLDPASLTNLSGGTLEATNGATLVIDASTLTNNGTIEAVGAGSEVIIEVNTSAPHLRKHRSARWRQSVGRARWQRRPRRAGRKFRHLRGDRSQYD